MLRDCRKEVWGNPHVKRRPVFVKKGGKSGYSVHIFKVRGENFQEIMFHLTDFLQNALLLKGIKTKRFNTCLKIWHFQF